MELEKFPVKTIKMTRQKILNKINISDDLVVDIKLRAKRGTA